MSKSIDHVALWSCTVMIASLVPAASRAQAPDESQSSHSGLYANRYDPPHVPPLGAHASGQICRLPRDVHRATARLLRQRTIRHASHRRPTPTGSPSIAPTSCREPISSRRSEHRGSISCSPGSQVGPVRSTSSGPPTNPAWTSRAGRLCSPLSRDWVDRSSPSA